MMLVKTIGLFSTILTSNFIFAAESAVVSSAEKLEKSKELTKGLTKELTEGSFSDPSIAGNLIQTTLGLLVVLGVIAVAAWAFKRFGHFQSGMQGKLKVVGGISLGSRERVVLLQVGDKQLVVGVAPGKIQTLHVLDEPLLVENEKPKAVSFSERLQSAVTSRMTEKSNKNINGNSEV